MVPVPIPVTYDTLKNTIKKFKTDVLGEIISLRLVEHGLGLFIIGL